jgi:endonuclease YncB( thermonuclease family)
MRRRIATLLIAVGALALTGCSPWLTLDPADGDAGPDPAETTTAPDGPGIPTGAFPMVVVSITDGDTLRLQIGTANDVVTTTRPIVVRLIGIDTPEVYPTLECFGAQAEDELARLAPVGATIWVAPDRDSWDDYDRRLFYLWTDDGEFINLALVANGFAEAIRVAPNDRYFEVLLAAERDASGAGVGMWGAC